MKKALAVILFGLGAALSISGCTKRSGKDVQTSDVVATSSEPVKKGTASAREPEVKPEAPTATSTQPTGPETAIALDDRKILVRDCLLRLPQAKRVRASVNPRLQERLAALTDNDARTSAVLPATRNLPLEVVYHFGGAEVTPRELVVLLPQATPADARTGRVEVMVSDVSAEAGFQFLRADPLESSPRVQRFRLRPQSARWALLRFIPAAGSQHVTVAEVALLGHAAPPESAYAFKDSPVKALDLLGKLSGLSGVSIALSADEKSLIDDAKDGKLKKWTYADAALLVSGVGDAAKRKEYAQRIDELAAATQQQLAGVEGVEARSEKLLSWLHTNSLAKGYVADLSNLDDLLNRREYNCLSSALLYNVLAARLQLDARGVQVPDHAFSIVYDGTRHFDVETTTPRGFNPLRDKQAVAEFEKKTGFVYIPDSERDLRREVSAAGMLAMVYHNQGVGLLKQQRYSEAVGRLFRALSMDRELASTAKGALVVFARWSAAEAEAGRRPEALAIVRTGLELAPQDAMLRHARVQVWDFHARQELQRGGVDAALAALRRASADAPDGPFMQLQAWLFLRPGEAHAAAGRWEDAIAVVEPALTKVDPPAREELLRWRGSVFLRWANAEMAAGRFEQALALIERGMKLHPQDGRFPDFLAAAGRDWVETTRREKGEEEATKVAATLETKAKDQPALKHAARTATYWLVIELQEKGQHEQAESAADKAGPLVPGAVETRDVYRNLYDRWALSLMDKRDYRGAFQVYLRALTKLPDDPVMLSHLAYVLRVWLGSVEKEEGAEKVKQLIAELRKEHPKLKDVIGLSPATVWTAVRGLREAGEYSAALEALDRFAELLPDKAEVTNMYRGLYDHWADHVRAKSDRGAAVNVYEAALQRFPEDKHLKNNLAVEVQRWALELARAGREGEAKQMLLQCLARFPKLSDIRSVARDHVPLLVQDLRDEKKFEEALGVLDRHGDLMQELHGKRAEGEIRELRGSVYGHRTSDIREKKEWEKALDVYREGLRRYPNDSELKSRAAAIYDSWARTFFEKDWPAAIAVYDRGLKELGDVRPLKGNRGYCVEMQKREKK